MPFLQGEVYRLRPTDNLGKEREGEFGHRVLVVSAEKFNRGGRVTTVMFTTKRIHLIGEGNIVPFDKPEEVRPEFGLSERCVIPAETLTITPERYLGERLGRISDGKMDEVVEAIGHVLDASCFRG